MTVAVHYRNEEEIATYWLFDSHASDSRDRVGKKSVFFKPIKPVFWFKPGFFVYPRLLFQSQTCVFMNENSYV